MMNVMEYIEHHADEAQQLLIDLAQIPAPSNQEERRAAFCLDWLRSKGAECAYIDEALNVIYPIGDTGENDLVVGCCFPRYNAPSPEYGRRAYLLSRCG